MRGDLHTHSYYSDGYLSPQEVMRRAKDAGCDVVALTDHDTVDGIAQAREGAKAAGIKFLAGVEISAYGDVDGKPVETHILGYGCDFAHPAFAALLASQKRKRRERSEAVLRNLAARGILLTAEDFVSPVPREISRSHIADAIVHAGYEPDFATAFAKWAGAKAPTYVPMKGAKPHEAIDAVHAAGGLAVLAHPVRLYLTEPARTQYIEHIVSLGIDGIEAVYRDSSAEEVAHMTEIARRCGKFVTAGGDFHGDFHRIYAREIDATPLYPFME